MRAPFLLLICAAGVLWGAETISIEQLKEFIRSAIKLKHADPKVADYLKRYKLSNKLDLRTIEEMQGMGAGPKTVAVLKTMAESTSGLPEAAPVIKPTYVPPPPPDSVEQARVLSAMTEYARNYSSRMPDFICSQVTRRFVDPAGMEFWQKRDVITEQLSYFDKQEHYKVVLVNNAPVGDLPHEKLGGATSSGEFASIMAEIFDQYTQTHFEWERWATLREHRMHVFAYKVDQSRSKYSIYAQGSERIVVGYHGEIFVDRDRLTIDKITLQADDIPSGYPIRSVNLALDYGFSKIAEREYMLPLKAVLVARQDAKFLTKNEVEFRNYRKFSAEATITAYEPEPIPDSATKEQKPPAEKKP